MAELTEGMRAALAALAERHGVSSEAAQALLRAVAEGGGRMAQFSHPELGGPGQWMAGGLTMVGDMFNPALRGKVEALAQAAAALLREATGPGPAAGGAPEGTPKPGVPEAGTPEPELAKPELAQPEPPEPGPSLGADPLSLIERLAVLHRQGVLTEADSWRRRPSCWAASSAAAPGPQPTRSSTLT